MYKESWVQWYDLVYLPLYIMTTTLGKTTKVEMGDKELKIYLIA